MINIRTLTVKQSISCVSTHRCRSRQIFGCAKELCLNFPKLSWKMFERQTFQEDQKKTKKGLQSHQTPFFEKKVKFSRISFSLIWSYRNICAQIFWDFSLSFQDFARIFDKSKLLGMRLHPVHPSSYTTVSATCGKSKLMTWNFSNNVVCNPWSLDAAIG